MTQAKLARIVDPSALDLAEGPCGRARLEVPKSWLVTGAAITFACPSLLTCDRCRGGGCDSCRRSGAVRAPAEASSRVVRASIPGGTAAAELSLRIPEPFGTASEIRRLVLEIHGGEQTSHGVCRDDDLREAGETGRPTRARWVMAAALLGAAAVLAVLLHPWY